jgi:YD repeat-containing protein
LFHGVTGSIQIAPKKPPLATEVGVTRQPGAGFRHLAAVFALPQENLLIRQGDGRPIDHLSLISGCLFAAAKAAAFLSGVERDMFGQLKLDEEQWTADEARPPRRVSLAQAFTGATTAAPFGSNASSSGASSTTYSSQTTTATDEAGISRTKTVDGLGRLAQVAENGISATTNYVYDALGNLTGVTHTGFATNCYTPQGPAANRSFKYDSLVRLANACNPETSALTYYEYDGAFNLTARTDARGIRAALFMTA